MSENLNTTRKMPFDVPLLIDAKYLMEGLGLSRTMSYNLLANPSAGAISIGGRKFLNRNRFLKWLDAQTLDKGA